MKQPFLILAGALALLASGCTHPSPQAVANPDAAHTSRNALDWAGAYRGVLPCADCQGIETVVVLRSDGSYAAYSKYIGKGDDVSSREGRFTWNVAGNTVALEDGAQYFVGEGQLARLASDGSRVTGALADRYILAKLPEGGVTDRYWTLVELNGKPLPKLERAPWLMLEASGGRVHGFGGCNSFTGSYTLDKAASRIRFGQIATTNMACISGEDVERALHGVLGSADNYSLAGDTLSLNRARMAPLARFQAAYLR
jgi:heat shock protein HslJ